MVARRVLELRLYPLGRAGEAGAAPREHLVRVRVGVRVRVRARVRARQEPPPVSTW